MLKIKSTSPPQMSFQSQFSYIFGFRALYTLRGDPLENLKCATASVASSVAAAATTVALRAGKLRVCAGVCATMGACSV